MKYLLTTATLLCLAACVVVPVPLPVPATAEPASHAASVPINTTASFTRLLNDYRASEGRGPLRQNAALTRAAQAHAEDMVRRGYFSHIAPSGGNGATFSQRANAAGCALRGGAENIATGQRSEAEVLSAWESSSGHRRNMLVASYREYGLGRAGNIWVLKLAAAC